VAERLGVVVIGAGPAGLATSHELTEADVEHVVLERGRIGQAWRGRWDSFCLVTPNWSVQLPGGAYDGDDPDGFMPRDDIVRHFERYARSFEAPVREGIEVTSLDVNGAGGFALRTGNGEMHADAVIVASGAYQRPHRPPGSGSLPAGVLAIDVEGYRNPDALPPGGILVVGSGQSGCQIAEELLEAGRDVFLACGRAPWTTRTIGGRDLVWWAIETGFADQLVSDLPDPSARLTANILASGRDGGHTLNLRVLRAAGVTLLGHFAGADDRRAHFADDLAETVAWGDNASAQFNGLIERLVHERGLPMPDLPEPEPFDADAPNRIDLDGIGAVIFAGGFRPDYGRWVRVPGAFDELGFPIHREGASLEAPGLFFVGVHFLRKRKSAVLFGMGEDASIVARQIASRGSGRDKVD
jgi:putative flavoprotein involved in K+ transport